MPDQLTAKGLTDEQLAEMRRSLPYAEGGDLRGMLDECLAEIDRLRAANAALVEATQWRPMAAAPKKGPCLYRYMTGSRSSPRWAYSLGGVDVEEIAGLGAEWMPLPGWGERPPAGASRDAEEERGDG